MLFVRSTYSYIFQPLLEPVILKNQLNDMDNSKKLPPPDSTIHVPHLVEKPYELDQIAYSRLLLSSTDIVTARPNSITLSCFPNQSGALQAAMLMTNEIQIYDIAAKAYISTIQPQEQTSALAYVGKEPLTEAPFLATGDDSGWVKIWDVLSGANKINIKFSGAVKSIVHLKDSIIAVSFANDGEVCIWDYAKFIQIYPFNTQQTSLTSLNNIGNGRLACGFKNGTVQIWEWEIQKKIFEALTDESAVNSVCELSAGKIAVGTNNGSVFQFDLNDNLGKKVYQSGTILALSKIDDAHIALGAFGDNCTVLNTHDWQPIWKGGGNTLNTYGISPSKPTGTFVICTTQEPQADSSSDNFLFQVFPSKETSAKADKPLSQLLKV